MAWHLSQFQPGQEGVVFTNKNGDWHRRISFGMALRKIVERSGVERDDRVTFHQLRHFYASALIANGEQPKAIQERMGHASLTMTLDTYGHLFARDDNTPRDAIEAAMRPASDGPGPGLVQAWPEAT